MTDQNGQPAIAEITAKPGSYYRNTRYIMAIACIGMGLWFGYDGFINWPQGNIKFEQIKDDLNKAQSQLKDAGNDQALRNKLDQDIRTLSEEQKKYRFHTNTDLGFQKFLCFTLPPLGIFIVALALYKSRGKYKLAGTTLSTPGHPDIQLDDITHIDKRLWERKGIAYLDYESKGGNGTIVLDDFLYDRTPTDEIFKQIEDYLRASTQRAATVPVPRAPRQV